MPRRLFNKSYEFNIEQGKWDPRARESDLILRSRALCAASLATTAKPLRVDGRESVLAAILRDASLCDAPQDEVRILSQALKERLLSMRLAQAAAPICVR